MQNSLIIIDKFPEAVRVGLLIVYVYVLNHLKQHLESYLES